jgi:hypothetical protein
VPVPKPPEVATRIGCLDDEAHGIDHAADAWGLREDIRNGNRFKQVGGLMFRALFDARENDAEAGPGSARGFGWPEWFSATPVDRVPAPKKPGLRRMRVAVRAQITSGKTLQLQFGTLARGNPTEGPGSLLPEPDPAEVLEMVGTGSLARYVKNDVVVQESGGDLLSFWLRGVADPNVDALMNTATFGVNNQGNGTVNWTGGSLDDPTSNWGATIPTSGHYVTFKAQADGRILYGPVPILGRDSATRLFFKARSEPLNGLLMSAARYEIREMSRYRLVSIAAYSVDAEVPTQ